MGEGNGESNKSYNLLLGKKTTYWCHEETTLLLSKEILVSEVTIVFKTHGSYIKSSCETYFVICVLKKKLNLETDSNILKTGDKKNGGEGKFLRLP